MRQKKNAERKTRDGFCKDLDVSKKGSRHFFAILSKMTGEADPNPFLSLSLLHFFLHPHIMLKLGGRVPGP